MRLLMPDSSVRLARDVMVQSLLLAKLAQHGITLINCVTGEDVTASMSEDPMRNALIQIQSVFSELEKSHLVSKLRRAREAKKRRPANAKAARPSEKRRGRAKILQ